MNRTVSMLPSPSLGRAFVIAGLTALVLAGCGRRGPLEAPDAAAAPRQGSAAVRPAPARAVEGQANAPGRAVIEDGGEVDEEDAAVTSPAPTPRPGRGKRGYAVPTTPFILDPLL